MDAYWRGIENHYCEPFKKKFEQLDDIECQEGYFQQDDLSYGQNLNGIGEISF